MLGQNLPMLSEDVGPPVIRGAACLAQALSAGVAVEELLTSLSGPFADDAAMLAASYDTSMLALLSARRELGLALQHDLLGSCRLFRIVGGSAPADGPRLRVLAFACPGDLQMNMPIEFITHHLHVRLDLLFVGGGHELPELLPEHDVAICVISDMNPDALAWLARRLEHWPRPVLNHPALVAGGQIDALTRDGISRLFADAVSITVPLTVRCQRGEIEAFLANPDEIETLLPGGDWPLLARPLGSHAGHLLERLEGADELSIYVESLSSQHFYLSRFVDYRGADGLFRKLRVALIDGEPFLCHMAVSDRWMIHYANAGMAESAAKRCEEARAMVEFDDGFARHHARAFALLHRRLGLDYVIFDCAEAPDGTLLLFEVEMAAIIHALDPVEIFSYKQPQMRRVFNAFHRLLHRASGLVEA